MIIVETPCSHDTGVAFSGGWVAGEESYIYIYTAVVVSIPLLYYVLLSRRVSLCLSHHYCYYDNISKTDFSQ